MHTVKAGPANQSYGIQVAKLAGIPNDVLQFASHKLSELEAASLASDNAAPVALDISKANTSPSQHKSSPQPDLFARSDNRLQEALTALNLDNMTPRDALDALYELKTKL
jgi:DNA mismatch repair protein MutS